MIGGVYRLVNMILSHFPRVPLNWKRALVLFPANLRKLSVSNFKLNSSLLACPENLSEEFVIRWLNATQLVF